MKPLTPISSSLLKTPPVETAILVDGTKLSLVGPDGTLVQLDLQQAMLSIFLKALEDKYNSVITLPTGDGSPVVVNPAIPKLGDLKTEKPEVGITGGVTSGSYKVFMYLQSGWKQIFP